jgi:hypothetical protein
VKYPVAMIKACYAPTRISPSQGCLDKQNITKQPEFLLP